MKRLLDEWGMFIFVGVVIVGLTAGNIYQSLSQTSTKLEEQLEFMDLMNFNQKIMDDNYKLLDMNRRQDMQIQQMNNFIQQMYRRLQQYEPLPDLEGDKDKPQRSEA